MKILLVERITIIGCRWKWVRSGSSLIIAIFEQYCSLIRIFGRVKNFLIEELKFIFIIFRDIPIIR